MVRETVFLEVDHSSLKLTFRKMAILFRGDKSLRILVVLFLLAASLIGLSGHYIQPYITQQSYTMKMYSYQIEHNGLNYPNQNLNIYAMAPDYPIYITILDSQHTVLDYTVYFINDTNNAVGFGPTTLMFSGQISDTTTIVIPHTIYHMTYRLHLDSPGFPAFVNYVNYTQTVSLTPPANYFLLIPGVVLALAGMVILGAKLITVTSDKDKYYSSLDLENPEDEYVLMNLGRRSPSRISFRQTWYGNIILGFASCALGFTIFGRGVLLSWFGVIFVILGIALLLNGMILYFSHR